MRFREAEPLYLEDQEPTQLPLPLVSEADLLYLKSI